MNNEYIDVKFILGSQLENWEFDLSALREYIENEICYEVYEYVGSDKSFLGIESHKIELSFNADILEKVEYYFKEELYGELLGELEYRLGKPVVDVSSTSWCFINHNFVIEKLSGLNVLKLGYELLEQTHKG